jgi:predicted nucleic acid-binding protein
LPVDSKTIGLAVTSDFTDFEDAIQYYCAIENNLKTIKTRNNKDYKKATITVLTPETFIAMPNLDG